jgi:hypothetical protein
VPFAELQGLGGIARLDHLREVRRRQGLEVEPALAGLHRHPVFLGLEGDLGILREGAQDVIELARADCDGPLRISLERRRGGDLHLEVRGEEVHPAARGRDQHIRENRQRMAPLDDARDLLQGTQQLVVRGLYLKHVFFLLMNS